MGVYEDGTRDCPGCEVNGFPLTHRVRGGDPLTVCVRCERVAHNDAMAGIAQMEPYLRRHGEFSDWRIEHGEDITR